MSSPMRVTAGFTQDAVWQPMGMLGKPNPFFYACYNDDFTDYNAGDYTVTASGGSVAATAGSYGRLLFTTGATATNFAEIQLKVAPFAFISGKKLFYMTRFKVSDATNSVINAGLIQTTTTPYTVTDGIYFNKADAGTAITLEVVSGSTTIGSVAIPTTLADNTDIDLAFTVMSSGDIWVYSGSGLIGQVSQNSGTLGPTAKVLASSLTAAMTTADLNPTLAIQTTAAAAITLNADLQGACLER